MSKNLAFEDPSSKKLHDLTDINVHKPKKRVSGNRVSDFRVSGVPPVLGIGGRSEWIGDDFCDDINNNEKCLYDDGDCCGLSAQKNFCFKCTCKGK